MDTSTAAITAHTAQSTDNTHLSSALDYFVCGCCFGIVFSFFSLAPNGIIKGVDEFFFSPSGGVVYKIQKSLSIESFFGGNKLKKKKQTNKGNLK
jgi:hypothetical protein